MTNNMEEYKEINLCDFLKGFEGRELHTPCYGKVILDKIEDGKLVCHSSDKPECTYTFDQYGRVSEFGRPMIYPCEGYFSHNNYFYDWVKFICSNKKVTYEQVCEVLFTNDAWQDDDGEIAYYKEGVRSHYVYNATSKKQLLKLRAINKLMNVHVFLEKGWTPDWKDKDEEKYFIAIKSNGIAPNVANTYYTQGSDIYFSSEDNARKAIEILGEEIIRDAISTDW